jgi:hypothetical protein
MSRAQPTLRCGRPVQQYLDNTTHVQDQYSEPNVMHFSINLLRIKGLYMLRALLSHPQEVLQTALGILRACYVSWLH